MTLFNDKKRWFGICCIVLGSTSFTLAPVVLADKNYNGFNLQDALISKDNIHHGGPPKDGIPALEQPRFIEAKENRKLKDSDRVLGIIVQGVKKAYPVRILDYHELVNDIINEKPVLISFCPLCGTGMAFEANIDNRHLHFGVSGLLYNSDVLMYDRETQSLWSQIAGHAISGTMKGTPLTMLPIEHTSWGAWRARHPDTLLLSFSTGYRRNYKKTPYVGYSKSKRLYFPVTHSDKRFHPKEVVIGVNIDNIYKAYPFIELSKSKRPLVDKVGNSTIQVHFDEINKSARIVDEEGELVPSLTAFWFAWYAFHPDTQVFKSN